MEVSDSGANGQVSHLHVIFPEPESKGVDVRGPGAWPRGLQAVTTDAQRDTLTLTTARAQGERQPGAEGRGTETRSPPGPRQPTHPESGIFCRKEVRWREGKREGGGEKHALGGDLS